MPYFLLLRPHQWVKNTFVFAALLFGRKLFEPLAVIDALLGFVALCLISSHVYVINDIHDREEDRLHPRKCKRPIASGKVTVPAALSLAAGLFIAAFALSWWLEFGFFLIVLLYFLIQVGYTFVFKHMALLDVIVIGTGFVLRAIAGAVLVEVEISPWLVLCTFTLCLFMGFSKRRCELNALATGGEANAGKHRRTLLEYTPELLNHMTTVTAGIAIVSFMLYATDERTLAVFGTNYLVYTLPLVVYAVFRFALLVEHGRVDGPTDVLLRDPPFLVSVLLWAIAAVVIVYKGVELKAWVEAA